MYVKIATKDSLQVAQEKELFAWTNQRFEYIVDRIVFLEDQLLFVDFNCPLKIDTIVEEFHQRLYVQFVLNLFTGHRLEIMSSFLILVSCRSELRLKAILCGRHEISG